MEEVWKKIDDFNYEVSSLGNVRRIGTRKNLTHRLNKPKMRGSRILPSYPYVRLSKNNKDYSKFIHRLVALAFIPNPDNKPVIDHIDNNPLNYSIDNLRWATISENACNTKCYSSNKYGMKGVYYSKVAKKYHSSIRFMNERYYLGSYETAEEAFEAYKKKAEELHGGFRST